MNIPKREDELKEHLFDAAKVLPSSYFLLPIQDVRKSGTPDFTLNGEQYASWWEVKHATPHFRSPGIQEVICKRLSRTSFCRYIIYVEAKIKWSEHVLPNLSKTHDGIERFTVIIHPDFVFGRKGKLDWAMALSDADAVIDGFDHEKVVEHMRSVHTL